MTFSKHSRRIAISFIVVLSLSITMMLFDLTRMKNMQSKLDVITKEHNVKSSLMTTMKNGIYDRQVSLRNIMLMDGTFERDEGKTKFASYALNILDARKRFSSMKLDEKEKLLLEEINESMPLAYAAQIKLIDNSIYFENKKITSEDLEITFETQTAFMNKVNKMIELQKNATILAVMDAGQSYESAKKSVFVLGGATLLFSIFIAIYIIRFTESQKRKVNAGILQLEESHDLMEQRVIDRTIELEQARDLALESNRAKDNFITTMSHELRTPLNIIIGYSEMLEEQSKEENIKGFIPDLKKIQSAAHHQLKLVSSILDVSKIEEGKLEMSPVNFDIRTLALEVEAAVLPLTEKNNNVFKIDYKQNIGNMYSDVMRIHQVLLNLLSNAAKFTHEGLITLNIYKDKSGDNINFEVKDTGIGITEKYMDELFLKFTQADSSTTREYGGSGLGLTISKQLSILLKGDITVTSEKEKGSCFTLTLPTTYIA